VLCSQSQLNQVLECWQGLAAFSNRSRLWSISMPSSVKRPRQGSFNDCRSLANVTLNYSSPPSISIPLSMERLGENSFCRSETLSSEALQPCEHRRNDVATGFFCGGSGLPRRVGSSIFETIRVCQVKKCVARSTLTKRMAFRV
jgi:hypothetical protein